MSNLGLYQSMTTWAKKVGGPRNFLLLVAAGGYGVFRLSEAGIKKFVKAIIRYKEKKSAFSKTYEVHSAGESNEGLHFNVGDTFCVLERDNDAVLIELVGADNNPYFVSAELLQSISNYKLT